jgi:2-polyprenyl-3-methyl-5-hydroxy-6-metoxy-1,4-benzoquinol methylase
MDTDLKVPAYALGYTDAELRRLDIQSRFLFPFTSALLTQAGVRAGMRVLDIGCGIGTISMTLAELVGSGGEVVGIDIGAPAIRQAEQNAKTAGLSNVRFLTGDEHPAVTMATEQPFDAVFGRFVFLHQKDPVHFVKTLAQGLRAEGLLIFQDPDYSIILQTSSACPLLEQVRRLILLGHELVKLPTHIALRTAEIFEAAGLLRPTQRMTCPVVTLPPYEGVCEIVGGLVRSFANVLVKSGMASAEEIGIDTLVARLQQELLQKRPILQTLCLSDAWLKLPASYAPESK